MQLSKNFHLSELVTSNTATRRGINNTPSDEIVKNLQAATVNLFQPVRDILGHPVIINSGYRSPALNKAVGGVSTSAHCYGYAIDFICPSFGTPKEIVQHLQAELKKKGIKFDQCIVEYNTWVHLAWKNCNGLQRCKVFEIK